MENISALPANLKYKYHTHLVHQSQRHKTVGLFRPLQVSACVGEWLKGGFEEVKSGSKALMITCI